MQLLKDTTPLNVQIKSIKSLIYEAVQESTCSAMTTLHAINRSNTNMKSFQLHRERRQWLNGTNRSAAMWTS